MDCRQADTSTLVTIGHLSVAFVLTYLLGFERTLRGAAAGNRTFSMIGVGAALVAVLALDGAPNALAGVITGVGFIGGGLVFRQSRTEGDLVHGVTTAGAIFAAAAIGAAAGQGRLALATAATAFVILASARTSASALPRIGVISGATIIAPITVAVESPTTPADAMTAASTSRTQKRVELGLRQARSMNRAVTIRSAAVASTRGITACPRR